MEVVYQMKTADCLQDKSWRNFSSFRCHLASRQFARHILSVCVVRVSDVTRPAAGCDSSSGVGVSRRFTAAWIRLADMVIAVDGSYSRAGTCFVTSLRHPQRLTTLSLRRVKSFSRLSLSSPHWLSELVSFLVKRVCCFTHFVSCWLKSALCNWTLCESVGWLFSVVSLCV